jgi:hypothetical protein
MSQTVDLIRTLKLQSRVFHDFGSPFYGGLMAHIAADVEADGAAVPLFAPWAGADMRRLVADAVPLRIMGALHARVLTGEDRALAAVFPEPGRPADPDAAWPAVREAFVRGREAIVEFMAHEPQTNEVRRSACLLPGFLTVAQATGLPLRCFELGASAGLNQNWDRFSYRLGEAVWGDPASPVFIDTDWQGGRPPLPEVTVLSRAACDRRPVDLNDDAERLRLIAYLWPDQFERLDRARAAIALAQARGTTVETADAAAWTARVAAPARGAATVVYHSVFWQYVPPEGQAALRAAIEGHGASATADAPFAWLSMEPDPADFARLQLRLTMWPGGEERVLADVHAHGQWVKWRG